MKKNFLLIFLLHLAMVSFAQIQKVETSILNKAKEGKTVEVIIYLKEQADLNNVQLFSTKEERTAFVFQQLSEKAQQTQQNLISFLEKNKIPFQSFWIVNCIQTKVNFAQLQALSNFAEVGEILPNYSFKVEQTISEDYPILDIRADSSFTWGIEKIGANKVWAKGFRGKGIVIGGQDTGYEWEHAAIKEKYLGWNGTIANHNYAWHDAIHELSALNPAGTTNPCGLDTKTPCDDDGHGTHTMGTMVGGQDTTKTRTYIGVAPEAKWIGCRNMDRGWGKPSTYIECFQWFLAPTDLEGKNPDTKKAPHVINNSWGCPPQEGCNASNFATMEAAVNNLRNAGIVVVVSAGNDGRGVTCASVKDPAPIFANSFAIGATNTNDTIASFSSRGPVRVDGSLRIKPDVSAPGVGVRSATKNNAYVSLSGTSMAGPHVAGAVALLLSKKLMLPQEVEILLKQTARKMLTKDTCGGNSITTYPNNTYGYGRINVFDAIEKIKTTSINESIDHSIQIFPNPTEATFFVKSSIAFNVLNLFDAQGRLLQHWEMDPQSINTFDIRKHPQGLYFIQILDENKQLLKTEKLIKE